jgi:hypothetical protein
VEPEIAIDPYLADSSEYVDPLTASIVPIIPGKTKEEEIAELQAQVDALNAEIETVENTSGDGKLIASLKRSMYDYKAQLLELESESTTDKILEYN